jgi:hypothetical protein
MKTRIAVPAVLLALLTLLPAAPAAALNWGLGADLGYSLFMPSSDYGDDLDNISQFGLPFDPGMLFDVAIPTLGGLRLSFAGENPMHEVWLGTSLSRLSVKDFSFSMMEFSGNYQFNFATQGGVDPYLTAGVGLYRVGANSGSDGQSATSAYFGGGVGAAYKMGSGRLRGELRYDVVTEGTIDDDQIIIPKGGALGLKLGFDLWNK